VAAGVVAILLIALPGYRWFFLISVLIGLVIAGGLTLWHRLHPIEEQDVEPKRPLGL
jgi:MFS family permease